MLKRLITVFLICVSGTTFGQSAAAKYIDQYKEDAIQKMKEYGIPASIILGVAMHESGSGTSKIAKYLNNHFGVKGSNQNKQINSSYKGYESVSDSYEDFISLLKARSQFSKLFDRYDANDYKSWAKGIQRGGYAHSSTWSSQVLSIINKYHLYQYDSVDSSALKLAYANPLAAVPAPKITASLSTPKAGNDPDKVYKVKRGDTLLQIARRFGTTVKSIKIANNLKTNLLSIGQRLKL